MWQILKAEFKYYKTELFWPYALSPIFLIAAVFWWHWGLSAWASFTAITFFSMLAIIGSTHDSEKRTRFHATLPVRPVTLGIADVLFVVLFQLGMYLFWVAYLMLQPGPADSVKLAGFFSGVALAQSVVILVMINTHLGFMGKKSYRWLFYEVLFFVALALALLQYAGQFMPSMRFLLQSYWGALAMNLIWLGLSALCVKLFTLRKSYFA